MRISIEYKGRHGEKRNHPPPRQSCRSRCLPRPNLLFLVTTVMTTTAIVVVVVVICKTFSSSETNSASLQWSQVQHDHSGTTATSTHPLSSSSSTTTTTTTTLYHEMRTDRSGSVIYDMLLAHSYAYFLNTSTTIATTYGGACYYNETPMIRTHQQFIDALGLNHILHFVPCPTITNLSTTSTNQHNDTNDDSDMNIVFIQDRHVYLRHGATRLWTTEWLRYIRSLQKSAPLPSSSQQQRQQHPPPPLPTPPRNERNVVVHIRRGDVSLCHDQTYDRYIPNAYYQTLLQRYTNPTTAHDVVTIYSESNSTEPWSDFGTATLKLDESPVAVWYAIMNADIVILSWSSFAIVPALFNRRVHEDDHNNDTRNNTGGTIIYTPFWIQVPTATPGFENWIAMEHDLVRNMRRTKERLRQELCTGH